MNRGVDHGVCYTQPPSPMDCIGYSHQYDMYKITMFNHTNHSNPAQATLNSAEKAQTFEKMFTTPQSPAIGERKAQG